MSFYVKEALENVKRQIAEHRKIEARQNTQSSKLVGGEHDTVIPPGILHVVYLYKIMEQLSTGRGFREARVLALTSGNRFFDTLITCFKTLSGFYIITGHVNSTPLHNFIKRQERFNDEELRFYAEELVCAVDYLHFKGIIHRNLTAGNIKLTAEGHIKVYNLELAYVAQDEHGDRQAMPKVEGPVGLDAYMPPEMVDRKIYGYSVDWWGLGVILYFMMTGRMPFTGLTKRELQRAIKYKKPTFDGGLHEPRTHDLIGQLLEKNPSKRLGYHGASEVMNHVYFSTTAWGKVLSGDTDPPFLPATSAVTSLPSAICLSLEHLSGSEPVQKSISRRELERQQDYNIAPNQYIDFELEHDWSTYLHPDVSIELALHYMHGELRPPKHDDDYLKLEESITAVPELSAEEVEIFRQYAAGACVNPTTLVRREMGDGSFRMLTEAEAAEYDRNPDGYCDDLFTKDDPRSTVGTLHDEFSHSMRASMRSQKSYNMKEPSSAKSSHHRPFSTNIGSSPLSPSTPDRVAEEGKQGATIINRLEAGLKSGLNFFKRRSKAQKRTSVKESKNSDKLLHSPSGE